jgi:hypothetical protein
MNTVGFVMMLDVSTSIGADIELIKIYSKAFVRQALPKDQFGVNQFRDSASWIYPTGTNPNIVTVSPFKAETKEAADLIENISSFGNTNIGDAIKLGNGLISQSTSDINAFVLFSDGAHNVGPAPDTILGNTPPVYVAALGYYMKESYFTKMLSKNPKSKFYKELNVVKVMEMFNEIRSDSADILLTANEYDDYNKGSDYILKDFNVPGDSKNMQLSVVWTNKKYQYTNGTPSDYFLNVILIDPNNNTTDFKPDITDKGFCIFNLDKMYPGNWKCLVQYVKLNEALGSTVGALSLDTSIKVNVDAPHICKAGESVNIDVSALAAGTKIDNMSINVRLSRPLISVEDAIKKHHNDIKAVKLDSSNNDYADEDFAKLIKYRALNLANYDIMERENRNVFIRMSNDGRHSYIMEDTRVPGIYTLEFNIEGIDPLSKGKFTCKKKNAFVIE